MSNGIQTKMNHVLLHLIVSDAPHEVRESATEINRYINSIGKQSRDVFSTTFGSRPKVADTKVAAAAELLRNDWLSYQEIGNRVGLKKVTVQQSLMPAVRKLHNVERQRMGVHGKYKYRITG